MSDSSVYDGMYRNYPNFFGPEPDRRLTEHHQLLDKSKPVLDLGAGQGRYALFLAPRGYRVDVVEPSSVACIDPGHFPQSVNGRLSAESI